MTGPANTPPVSTAEPMEAQTGRMTRRSFATGTAASLATPAAWSDTKINQPVLAASN